MTIIKITLGTDTLLLNLARLMASRFAEPLLNAEVLHQMDFTSGSIAGANLIHRCGTRSEFLTLQSPIVLKGET